VSYFLWVGPGIISTAPLDDLNEVRMRMNEDDDEDDEDADGRSDGLMVRVLQSTFFICR